MDVVGAGVVDVVAKAVVVVEGVVVVDVVGADVDAKAVVVVEEIGAGVVVEIDVFARVVVARVVGGVVAVGRLS